MLQGNAFKPQIHVVESMLKFGEYAVSP
ncbi:hypothetical protein D031_3545A, partial [Vibrio parahaemolyticus VP-48]